MDADGFCGKPRNIENAKGVGGVLPSLLGVGWDWQGRGVSHSAHLSVSVRSGKQIADDRQDCSLSKGEKRFETEQNEEFSRVE